MYNDCTHFSQDDIFADTLVLIDLHFDDSRAAEFQLRDQEQVARDNDEEVQVWRQ